MSNRDEFLELNKDRIWKIIMSECPEVLIDLLLAGRDIEVCAGCDNWRFRDTVCEYCNQVADIEETNRYLGVELEKSK